MNLALHRDFHALLQQLCNEGYQHRRATASARPVDHAAPASVGKRARERSCTQAELPPFRSDAEEGLQQSWSCARTNAEKAVVLRGWMNEFGHRPARKSTHSLLEGRLGKFIDNCGSKPEVKDVLDLDLLPASQCIDGSPA